jgi:hypothetical protein
VHADLTAPAFTEAVPGPFDLVLDFGTLDDLRPSDPHVACFLLRRRASATRRVGHEGARPVIR